jgi:two-component system, NarL family, invasion response regulator UvrY
MVALAGAGGRSMNPVLHGVRILLADDHEVVRFGYRMLLEGAGAIVVAEAGCAETAVQLYTALRPALVLMDVSMPGGGGLYALERIIAKASDARVLMVSAHADHVIPVRSLNLGACAYLCKQAPPAELLKAISRVMGGGRYLDTGLAERLALAQLSGSVDPLAALTPREFTVFIQLAQGRSVADIAREQQLGVSTVGTHLYHIKQKLDVRNQAELTLLAMRCGLLEAIES